MRVGIVTETHPPEINGVALTVAALAQGLADAGHAVHVVRPRQRADDSSPPIDGAVSTVLVRGVQMPRYPGLQFGMPAAHALRAAWSRARPDAIYVATEGPLGWSALRAARALGIPAGAGFHTRFDEFARHYGLGALTGLVFAYLRRFHRLAAATFVPTVQLAAFLRARGFGNVVQLPRAVDTRLFQPSRRDAALRAAWGADHDRPVVLYVGRIAAEKNLPLAVRSFRALQSRHPQARYVWVGDGPARRTLAAENPDFIFAGVQRGEELARHYASADLFTFPSLTETFGNVTLEALASGVPTVAFDYGAAHEHLDVRSGRLVPFGDADAFVDAVSELARSGAALEALRAGAREAVAALDPGAVVARFVRELAALGTAAGSGVARAGPGAPMAPAARPAPIAGERR